MTFFDCLNSQKFDSTQNQSGGKMVQFMFMFMFIFQKFLNTGTFLYFFIKIMYRQVQEGNIFQYEGVAIVQKEILGKSNNTMKCAPRLVRL